MSIDYAEPAFHDGPESLVQAERTWEDESEYSLRPNRLSEYIGQEKAKGNLDVFIQAAKMRQEPLDHVLLHGPPGLGKTTPVSYTHLVIGAHLAQPAVASAVIL